VHISNARMLSLLQAMPPVPPKGTAAPGTFIVEAGDRDALVRWVRASTSTSRVVIRSAVVLLADVGWTNARIAAQLGVSRRTVAFWKARYRVGGASSLLVDAPGRGRKPGRDTVMVSKILTTTRELPPQASRWTVRTLARAVGVSHATVQRVWREHGITPTSSRV
jgi:transposase